MISPKNPQEIINPKPKVNSTNCKSSHGVTGFLEGTAFDKQLGVFVCPCGRQYSSKIDKPYWMQDAQHSSPLPGKN